ncbi:MAG: DUF2894 domain-containing protein [Pseudomonadota bacterium]
MMDVTEPQALEQLLADLRQAGADQVDPVRFCYLDALEQRLRARGLQGSRHWRRLEQAVADYQAAAQQQDVAESLQQPAASAPPSPLETLLDALNQSSDTGAPASLSPLEQLIFGEQADGPEPPTAMDPGRRPLRTMTRAQADRGHQALHERIRQAIEQTPENAGPMNAHRLVSRAIATMEALSPEYLNRFVNYADTLLALERLAKKG